MVDYKSHFNVVWHGGMKNDPLGGHTKGCLIEPREQTEDERHRSMGVPVDDCFDAEFTVADLDRAVRRMNQTLREPLEFKPWNGARPW